MLRVICNVGRKVPQQTFVIFKTDGGPEQEKKSKSERKGGGAWRDFPFESPESQRMVGKAFYVKDSMSQTRRLTIAKLSEKKKFSK